MRRHEGDFARRGVSLVAIGQGTGEAAQRFCAKHHAGFPCLGDPERAAYRAFGLPRGSLGDATWKPLLEDPIKGIPRIFKADLAGARMKESDVRQLGGVAIVAPSSAGGRVRFRYRQRTSADLPEVAEILAALDGLDRA